MLDDFCFDGQTFQAGRDAPWGKVAYSHLGIHDSLAVVLEPAEAEGVYFMPHPDVYRAPAWRLTGPMMRWLGFVAASVPLQAFKDCLTPAGRVVWGAQLALAVRRCANRIRHDRPELFMREDTSAVLTVRR